MEVFGGVFVLGRITAAHVAANQAFPQMDPGIAHLEAFLAALAAGFDLPDFSPVGTGWGWTRHLELPPQTLAEAARQSGRRLRLLSRVFQKSLRFEGRH